MEYIAHKRDDKETQSVSEHLHGTAELAKSFAVEDFRSLAEKTAILHDIGKYLLDFQKRINGDNISVEHSICGAQECGRLWGNEWFAPLMEYCIAGHHSGLPDGGSGADINTTLAARMQRKTEDFSAYKGEITVEKPDTSAIMNAFRKAETKDDFTELYAFFTKYIFSCLTDADFIDTERFCNPNAQRGFKGDFEEALGLLNAKLASFKADNPVRAARADLLAQAVENAGKSSSQISMLNMPTGSGKTLCSLKVALEKALRDGKKRIIYVIPYTSIIEQTANTFSEILGESVEILQHHSNYILEDTDENACTAEKLKKTCENWDAPLVVTTSVQFFQSLYHYKGSRLRKLHNMAESVIVFDEIHLIPIEYLQPCLRAVGYITKYLNSHAIFLSATMPDYSGLFSRFVKNAEVCELITDKSKFPIFNNCKYTWLGKTSFEAIAQKADEYESSLIIVNKRKSAQRLYSMLSGRKFHLSTYMSPEHRSAVIAEIKECLKNHEKITVVSTSLVEAGVDFDFRTVFRELAGFDSILQAGGRCNREGERPDGDVFIFETDEKLKGDIGIRANIAARIIKENDDIMSDKCIKEYYNSLFDFNDEKIKANSIALFNGHNYSKSLPFRSYAENFEYIKSDTIGIAINNNEKCAKLLEKLKYGDTSVMRRLQRYTVSVYRYELDEILKLGILTKVGDVYVLDSNAYYDEALGFCWRKNNDSDFIM